MAIDWRKKTHEGWTQEIVKTGYDVVGVLKFDNGRHMQAKEALALCKAYWHKVDRTVYGCAADSGYGVKRICFSELGKCGTNLHVHFVAISPFATKPFCAVLNAMWTGFNRRTADYRHNWITPIQQIEKAAAYTCKGTKKLGTDIIGQKITFQPDPNLRQDEFDIEAQIRRLNSRVSDYRLEQAYIELEKQIVETTARMNRRNFLSKLI